MTDWFVLNLYETTSPTAHNIYLISQKSSFFFLTSAAYLYPCVLSRTPLVHSHLMATAKIAPHQTKIYPIALSLTPPVFTGGKEKTFLIWDNRIHAGTVCFVSKGSKRCCLLFWCTTYQNLPREWQNKAAVCSVCAVCWYWSELVWPHEWERQKREVYFELGRAGHMSHALNML